ncbi:MAG TPA: YCF48-related protein [Terriglobales bacterium]|nr:YCF48-related protein [Terriglobales bacterium]
MNPISKRLVPLLGVLVLLAGCGTGARLVAPVIPPLDSLSISPRVDTLTVGQFLHFVATAVDTSGHPYTGVLLWASGDPGVVTVTSTGQARAAGEGSAWVYVAGGGLRDSARVLVNPATTGWVIQLSGATENLNAVYFDPAGRLGWAVGDGGVILSTRSAGATWDRQRPTTFNLHGVWFTSATDGWAVGDAGTVLQTRDGIDWTRVPPESTRTSENLMHVHFATRDTGWVVGANGFTMRTFDRGKSWSRLYLLPLNRPQLDDVKFAGTVDGWAIGEDGSLLGTHDRGTSWFLWQPSLTDAPLKSLWMLNRWTAEIVGLRGTVLDTVAVADSAQWELRNAGNNYDLWGVCFPTAAVGYAVGAIGGQGAVLRSDNSGQTWTPQVVMSQVRLNAVYFVDPLRGWAVGNSGTIRHTATGGR